MGNISSTGRTRRRNKATRSAPDARARLPRNRGHTLHITLNRASLREFVDIASGGGKRSPGIERCRRLSHVSTPASPSSLHPPSSPSYRGTNDAHHAARSEAGSSVRIKLPPEPSSPVGSTFRRRLFNAHRYSHTYSEQDRNEDGLPHAIVVPVNGAGSGGRGGNDHDHDDACGPAPSWHPVDREDFNDPFYEEPLSPPEPAHAFDRNSFHSDSAIDSWRSNDERGGHPATANGTANRRYTCFLTAEQNFSPTGSNQHCISYPSQSFDEQCVVLDDRRYQCHDGVPYPLPSDVEESNRLQSMHRILNGVLKHNYIAPLDEPKMALDVGCGAGIWISEMASDFPDCTFVGLDISNMLCSDTLPSNCQFKQGNALKTLRFRPDTFDYIHQRMFALSLPRRHWQRICREYKRVLRPDGWLEFVETDNRYFRTGPIGERINDWLKSMYTSRGLEPRRCCLLPEILSDVGFPVVLRRVYSLPVGDWGKRLGRAILADAQAMLRSMWPQFQEALPELSLAEFEETIFLQWPSEADEQKTYLNLRVYWCQKE